MAENARPFNSIMQIASVPEVPLPSGSVLLAAFTEENFLGAGTNARVYSIDNCPDFVLRVPHHKKENGTYHEIDVGNFVADRETPKPVENQLFQGRNFGQPVAEFSDGTTILRRQPGMPAGLPNYVTKDFDTEQKDALYVRTTLSISQMPQETFTKALDDIRFLNSIDKGVDSSKPDNLLYDTASETLNFVDLVPKSAAWDNSPSDLLIMIFYSAHDYFYKGDARETLVEARRAILEKTITAAETLSIPFISQLRLDGEQRPGRCRTLGSSTQDGSLDACLNLAGYILGTPEREAIEKRILLTSMPEDMANARLERARNERQQQQNQEKYTPPEMVTSDSRTLVSFGSPV